MVVVEKVSNWKIVSNLLLIFAISFPVLLFFEGFYSFVDFDVGKGVSEL
jgi:hypothetical protein